MFIVSKYTRAFVMLLAVSASFQSISAQQESLPASTESVFRGAMKDPNVLFYFGEQSYQSGRTQEALSHFLEAAKYEHDGAVKNAKFMISKKMVSSENEQAVIDFLLYQARPEQKTDGFVTSLLAQYFEGSACLWTNCLKKEFRQGSFVDYSKSYYFHELAAKSGDARSSYTVGMMDLLGIGTARNPALALERFEQMASNGFVDGAYLCGRILQGVSGVMPQPERAMMYFEQAAQKKHPGAMLALAELKYRAGAQSAEPNLMDQAVVLYESVIDGAFATHEERVKAQYALANVLNSHPNHRSKKTFVELMNDVSNAPVSAEEVVRSNIALGDIHAEKTLNAALQYYTKASELLMRLPVVSQQRNADVWQKLAALYAKGDSSLDRSELLYGRHMTTYRSVMAKTPEPENFDSGYFQGYYVFTYPGT